MADAERIATALRAAVDEGVAMFRAVPEEQTTERPSPDAWCAREVIGHLIDSACNNQRRFVLNQDAARLSVESYDQDVWVARQRYADAPASELVATWASANRNLARVIEGLPDEVLNRGRGPMGTFSFPFANLPSSDPVTLRHLIEDYVGHIHHHFTQIRDLLGS